MVICTYFQQGRCRYGTNCKNEHPGGQSVGNTSSNRYGALSGPSQSRPAARDGFGNRDRSGRPPQFDYYLSPEVIVSDLTVDRPLWPISAYGPGRDAPRQLIEGPVEVSPEEMRCQYYAARAAGNEAAAQQNEQALAAQMQSQVDAIIKDPIGACKYVQDGAKQPGNRIDIAAQFKRTSGKFEKDRAGRNQPQSGAFSSGSGFGTSAKPSPFGQASTPAFGQSGFSALGQASNANKPLPFGQTSALGQGSGFGKPSMPGQAGSAFGQPSGLGQASGFGQASALGQNSAFGKPSGLGQASGFGQPSALGQGSAFGQPSQPGAASGFGQPSQPGVTPAFGQTSAPGQAAPSPFGQTSALGQNTGFGKPAFGQTGFGQPAQPTGQSPFAQPAQQAQNASPFGQTSAPGTLGAGTQQPAFGQTGFGKPNPFGQTQPSTGFGTAAPPTTSPFSQPPQDPKPNPFGQQTAPAAATPFSQPAPPPATNTAGPVSGDISTYATYTGGDPNRLLTWKGRQVTYFADDPHAYYALTPNADPRDKNPKMWERIWFPNGPTQWQLEPAKAVFKEGEPAEYEGENGKKLEEIYRYARETGRFKPGEPIPLCPPKMEWVEWAL